MDGFSPRCQKRRTLSTIAFSKRFGITVRSYRTKAGISQETLAELSRIHPTYVSMVERGVRNATLDVAARIADALQVPFSKLIEDAQAQPVRKGRTKRS